MSDRDEQVVYGLRTCRAIFETRREEICRIYFHADRLRALAPMLKWAAETRRVYRQLPNEELAKVSKSLHHEGVVLVVRPREWSRFDSAAAVSDGCWLALDRIENPHSLGMMIRTAAYFGATGVLAGGVAPGVRLSGALLRMAEGGAERVVLAGTLELAASLGQLRERGYRVIGLDATGREPMAKRDIRRPICFVVGSDPEGLSTAVRRACSERVSISGKWPDGSLAVTVVAGIALAAWACGEAEANGGR